MTHCLLILPHYESGKGSILKSFDYTIPPIGLLSIAAYLRQHAIKVSLLDLTIENLQQSSFEHILKNHIETNGIPHWIGISVSTPVAYNAYYISDVCKKLYPETKLVMGGPHITIFAHNVFNECTSVDYLITGEGEYTLCDLIKFNDLSPDNLLIKASPASGKTKPATEIDVTKLPIPAYDLLKFKKYFPPPSSLNSKQPGIGIITSRGCPYHCTFCTKISGSKLRLIPIPKIIDEIKYLKKSFLIKQLYFYDDTITCNKQHITDLCNALINEKLNIHWSCFARVDTVDQEMLMLMKQAGCFVIMYGIESMNDDILKKLKKGITVNQIKTALELTKKAGIESRISLIIGTPHETHETINTTKKQILRLKTDFLQVFIAVPMPGSQFFLEAKAQNRLLSEHWADYNLSKVLYKHPVFTEQELFRIQRQFYISFYLRFKIIWLYISKLNSLTALKNILRGINGFMKIISVKKENDNL